MRNEGLCFSKDLSYNNVMPSVLVFQVKPDLGKGKFFHGEPVLRVVVFVFHATLRGSCFALSPESGEI